MRPEHWRQLVFVMLIAFAGICEKSVARAEGRYLTLSGPDGFFFMLDRMTGGCAQSWADSLDQEDVLKVLAL